MSARTIEQLERVTSPPGGVAPAERPGQDGDDVVAIALGTPAPVIDARRLLGVAVAWDPGVDDVAKRSAMLELAGAGHTPPPSSRAALGSRLAFLEQRPWPSVLVAIGFVIVILLSAGPVDAGDGCYPIEVTWYSPTGVAGCAVYGAGTASRWGGPGVARNDCTWPWVRCQAIAVQSLATGITIVVTPRMYGDLYTGTPNERIVDLDPESVLALGLNPADGLYAVEVWPVDAATGIEQWPEIPVADESAAGGGVTPAPAVTSLPDTALAP